MHRLKWLRAQWDRVGAGAAVSVGLLAVLLGWLGARDTAYPAEQIPYVISGAVLGVILVGIGATVWLSADLRDEWRKLDRIERIIAAAATGDEAYDAPGAAAATSAAVRPDGGRVSLAASVAPVGTAAAGDLR